MKSFYSKNIDDTRALASKFAAGIKGGEIIFLRGPIGAGKTVFVKALAEKLGLKGSPVSASFSIMKEYKGAGCRMFHVDLFRLEEEEMFNLGFEEMLQDEKAVIVIEWPGAIERLITGPVIDLDFVLSGGDSREIKITSRGAAAQKFVELL